MHVSGQSDHDVEPLLSAMRKVKMKVAATLSMSQSTEQMTDDCAIPIFATKPSYELPKCSDPNLLSLIEIHKQLFNTSPGRTTVTKMSYQQWVTLLRNFHVEYQLITMQKSNNNINPLRTRRFLKLRFCNN